MSITLTWHGHGTYSLNIDGAAVVVDPFFAPNNPAARVTAGEVAADVILQTHGHGDHITDTVALARRTGALVIGNFIYPRMQADTQNIDPVATLLALSFWTLMWGLAGAFLAVPMTLMLMMAFAQFDATRWVAVLLSNDGRPDFRKSP